MSNCFLKHFMNSLNKMFFGGQVLQEVNVGKVASYKPSAASVRVRMFTKSIALLVLVGLGVNGWGQATVFTDNFNRASVSPGGTPSMTYTNAVAAGVTVSTNSSTNLRIAHTTTSGVSYVYGATGTFSSPYNTTLASNTGAVSWTFNFRWNRPSSNNPALPASGAYGQAIILAASGTNLSAGTSGYAIVYGNAGTPDPIRLVRFGNGVAGTLTDVISSGTSNLTATNNYASIRVTYDPSTNSWALFIRDDGASAWSDPSTGVTSQIGTNTVNNTYTGSPLPNFGFLWSHANTAGNTGDFDNFSVTVTSASGPTNPTPQSLPYTQDFGTTSFATYPTGFAGWNGLDGGAIADQTTARATVPTGNATLTAQGTVFGSEPSGGLRGYATSSNGRLAISSSNNNGDGLNQPVFAINTGAGNTSLTVAYDLEILYSGNRTQGMELEYRVGTTGSWTAVPNSAVTYSSPTINSITGYAFTITGLTVSTNYQFRWASWRNQGSGTTNTTIGIDNLVVTAGQPTFTEVFLPQYIQGTQPTNTERVPYAYRATLSNLLPTATYRFYNQVVTAADLTTTNGAGNCIFPVSAGAFTSTTNPSLSTTGAYGSFTTNGSGSYTGWFITEPSGNSRFAPGTLLNMRIMLNTSLSGSVTEDYRLSSTNTVQVLGFAASAGANNGTAIRSTSNAAASNFVMLYNNAAGTGRPLAGTFVESDGTANTTGNNYANFYSTSVNGVTGSWGTIIPNTNANGVCRIEQFALSNGASVGCAATDADGSWPTGPVNTVNPTGGAATPLVIANADGSFTCPYVTSATDYFRSNVTSGNWTTPSSWQSSLDNSTWYTSTLAPTSAANTITIRTGHTIQVNTTVTLDQTIVIGKLEILDIGTLSIQNGTGTDLIIQNGGELNTNSARNYNVEVTYATSSTIEVQTGGKISIGTGVAVGGSGYDGFTTRTGNAWQTGSIYEWNNTGAFASSGITYFANAGVGTKPIFRVTLIGGTSPGGGSATTINGIIDVNSSFAFIGTGAKTFRDGITGTATLTISSVLGTTSIIEDDAILGGSVTLVLNRVLNINSLQVPIGANVTLSSSSTAGITKDSSKVLTVNGTLDLSTVTITNTSGSIDVNGTLKTSKPGGLRGTGANVASSVGSININDGSTVEYNANVNQSITSTLTYYHLVLSGTGGTKTPNSAITINDNGSLTLSGAASLDATSNNIGPANAINAAAFTMSSTGTFILGTTGSGRALPWMDGTYLITNGIIRYNGSGQTIRNKAYQNIEVTGSDVGNSNGNITINDGGTFTIKSGGIFSINANSIVGPTGSQTVTIENGGTFACGNVEGLVGPTPAFGDPAAAIRNDINTIVLATGSTINYSRAIDAQKFTARTDYSNVVISGGGEKIVQGPTTIQGILTLTNGIVTTTSTNILTITTTATTSGGSNASFVNGPMQKQVTAVTGNFVFPVGKGAAYQPVTISEANDAGTFRAEYFPSGATTSPRNVVLGAIFLGVWANKYWNVERIAGTSTARVGLPYVSGGDSWFLASVKPNSNVAVAHFSGGGWQETLPSGNFNDIGPSIIEAIVNTGTGTIFSGTLTSFSPFTVGWGEANILPLTFIRFTVQSRQNTSFLEWMVADATSADYYEIEYGTTPSNFVKVGTLSTNQGSQYQFTHLPAAAPNHYYRIKARLKSGGVLYSKVEKISVGETDTYIYGMVQNPVMQNDARLKVYSRKSQNIHMQLFDMSGRLLLRKSGNLMSGNNIVSMPASLLAAGMYRLSVTTDDGTQSNISFIK